MIVCSSDPEYPIWVCKECGLKAVERYGKTPLICSTYHTGLCEVCGKKFVSVTESRDFGYPPFEIRDKKEDVVEIHSEVKDLEMDNDIEYDIEDKKLRNALVFCDIDGILADCSHRLPYLEKKEYDKFYGATMAEDSKTELSSVTLFAFLFGLSHLYHNVRLIFLTGRPERTKALTRLWLRDNYPTMLTQVADLEDDDILCRGDDDWRPAPEVKMDLAVEYLLKETRWTGQDHSSHDYVRGEFDTYIIDDDPNVIKYFTNSFASKMVDNGLSDIADCHALLFDSHRLADAMTFKSSSQRKSPEE